MFLQCVMSHSIQEFYMRFQHSSSSCAWAEDKSWRVENSFLHQMLGSGVESFWVSTTTTRFTHTASFMEQSNYPVNQSPPSSETLDMEHNALALQESAKLNGVRASCEPQLLSHSTSLSLCHSLSPLSRVPFNCINLVESRFVAVKMTIMSRMCMHAC